MKLRIRRYTKTIISVSALIIAIVNILQHNTPQPNVSTPLILSEQATATQSATVYQVIKVVDGDTIQVEMNGKKETLRLIGIDTPETVDPRKPVQCFGLEASAKTKELLSGKRVTLEADPTQGERDKYKRLLRYVHLEDGTFVNELLIREGFAHEYTYQSNPYIYQSEFKEAEIFAQTNKKGLWADTACRP